MALFNSKKTPEEKEQEKTNSKQKRIEDITECNIIEGIECEVIFPENQIKTTRSSGTKKGLLH